MSATNAPKRPRRKRVKTDEANLVDMLAESDALNAAMETLPSWGISEAPADDLAAIEARINALDDGAPADDLTAIEARIDALDDGAPVDDLAAIEARINALDDGAPVKAEYDDMDDINDIIAQQEAEEIMQNEEPISTVFDAEYNPESNENNLALVTAPSAPPLLELSDYVPDDMALAVVPTTSTSLGAPADKRIALLQQWTDEAYELTEKAKDGVLSKHDRERVGKMFDREANAKEGLDSNMFAPEVVDALQEFVTSVEQLKFMYDEELNAGDDDDEITHEQALAHPDVRAKIEAAVTETALKEAAEKEQQGDAVAEFQAASDAGAEGAVLDPEEPVYDGIPYTARELELARIFMEYYNYILADDEYPPDISTEMRWFFENNYTENANKVIEMIGACQDFLEKRYGRYIPEDSPLMDWFYLAELPEGTRKEFLKDFMQTAARWLDLENKQEDTKVDVSDMVDEAARKAETAKNISAAVNQHETVDEVADVTGNQLDQQVNEELESREGDPGGEGSDDEEADDSGDNTVTKVVELNPLIPALAQKQVDAATVLPSQPEQDKLNGADKVAARIKELNGVQEARPVEIDLNVVVPPKSLSGVKDRRCTARTAGDWVKQVVKYIYNSEGFIHNRPDYVKGLEKMAATIKTANGIIAKKIPTSKNRTFELVNYFLSRMSGTDINQLARALYDRLRDGGNGARDVQNVYTFIRSYIYNTLKLGPITNTFITSAPEVEEKYILALEDYQDMARDMSIPRTQTEAYRQQLLQPGPDRFNVHDYGFGSF